MPKYVGGLGKHGRIYYMKFKFRGRTIHETTGCEHRDAARAIMAKRKEDLAKEASGIRVINTTLSDALGEWQAASVAVPGHVSNVVRAIRLHCKDLLPLKLDEIGPVQVEAMRTAYLKAPDHSAGGANKVCQHLLSVIRWKAKDGRTLGIKKLQAQERVEAVVWPEQVPAFIEAADKGRNHHSATAISMMIALGLRESEAIASRWEWIDKRRRVYIVGESKSRQVREIPIPDWLWDYLEQIREKDGNPDRGAILPDHAREYTRKPVERCARILKIHGLHPHRLRATFATAHFESGTPLSQIQQMLGHADPETTMGYIVQRPKDQAESQAKVADAMGMSGNRVAQTNPTPKDANEIKDNSDRHQASQA